MRYCQRPTRLPSWSGARRSVDNAAVIETCLKCDDKRQSRRQHATLTASRYPVTTTRPIAAVHIRWGCWWCWCWCCVAAGHRQRSFITDPIKLWLVTLYSSGFWNADCCLPDLVSESSGIGLVHVSKAVVPSLRRSAQQGSLCCRRVFSLSFSPRYISERAETVALKASKLAKRGHYTINDVKLIVIINCIMRFR